MPSDTNEKRLGVRSGNRSSRFRFASRADLATRISLIVDLLSASRATRPFGFPTFTASRKHDVIPERVLLTCGSEE